MLADKSDIVILIGIFIMLIGIYIFMYYRIVIALGAILFPIGILIFIQGQRMCPSHKKKVKNEKGAG